MVIGPGLPPPIWMSSTEHTGVTSEAVPEKNASSASWSFSIDKFTKTNLTGIFDKIGYVHFSTEEHIKSLFKNYKILLLEENITNQIKPKTKLKTVAFWNLVAQKKN